MDVDELELAQVQLRKDAIMSGFAYLTAKWHGVQGASAAAIPLVAIAHRSGAIEGPAALEIAITAAGVALLAEAVIRVHGWQFARSVDCLEARIERLKRRGGPC